MSKGISRRRFTRGLLAAGLTAALKPFSPALGASDSSILFDYIVIGSGAGGGPVAARLANEGYKVALLEAGLDALGRRQMVSIRLQGLFTRYLRSPGSLSKTLS
jgi:heterodisulfide reductase subunit A-like polyferredoxin